MRDFPVRFKLLTSRRSLVLIVVLGLMLGSELWAFAFVGDLNRDNIVDIHDVSIFAGYWLGEGGAVGDFDESGRVDMLDFALLAGDWLQERAPLQISEFMASNGDVFTTVLNGNEISPDWIEIHNFSTERTIDLGGMYLTDSRKNLRKWPFPPGVELSPGQYLLIMASNQNEADYPVIDDNGYYHTNFKLDSDGEYLALVGGDGKVIDEFSPAYPKQRKNYSYGVFQGQDRYFTTPTPGEDNRDPITGFVADTRFSRDRGFYAQPFDLVITSDTEGAVIRYTLDGSEPSMSNGFTYSDDFWQPRGGRISGAVKLDGEDDFIAIEGYPGILGSHSRTVSAWIKTTHSGEIASWGAKVAGGRFSFMIDAAGGVLRVSVGGGYILGSTDLQDDNWHHVAAVLTDDGSADVSEIRLYVDGQVESVSASSAQAINTATDGDMSLGMFGGQRYYQGLLDDVRLYDRALTSEEIAALADLQAVSDAGLLARWQLDETEGSTVTDSAGNHDGTLFGRLYIDKTTVVRARAFKEGWMPTNVDTESYLFLDDIIKQDYQATLDAGFPPTWGGVTPDYGFDPDVIGSNGEDLFNGLYSGMIRESLLSLPTLSIVLPVDDMFGTNGIYTHSTEHGEQWERPASVELIDPCGTGGFQIDCGIRIQGGWFRNHNGTRKHSFRLLFKDIYGATKLRYPLFGKDATDEFDTITLRAGANDGYSWSSAYLTEQYTRDEFGRSLQRATGHAGSHGMFVHLYIDGIYWGLYNPVERPDHSFSANYYGGNKDDWDSIHDLSPTNGDMTYWNLMLSQCRLAGGSYEAYEKLQGRNPDGTLNPDYPVLMDVANYVDYLIVNLWGGNWDWPWKNWWAGRARTPGSTGFKFYCWDFENTMGNNRSRSPLDKNALNNNFTSLGELHKNLVQNPEYRMLFADHVHSFFFNGGVLTPPSLVERYRRLADSVELSIVAESARWGDQHHYPPLTLQEWLDERDWILDTYLPQRSAIVLQQFRNAGLYPDIDAPEFSIDGSRQHGGAVARGALLSIDNPNDAGMVYYTLDGSDPRLPNTGPGTSNTLVFVPEDASKTVLVPQGDIGVTWRSDLNFDDSAWISGTGGVGYEHASGYQNLFQIDVLDMMYGGNTSCYIRIRFNVDPCDLEELDSLKFRIREDDGFSAWLNGLPIAQVNAPAELNWNSHATSQTSDGVAVNFQEFDISAHLADLHAGENLLAVHGLNVGPTSSDFLNSVELVAVKTASQPVEVSPTAVQYEGPIPLNENTRVKARVLHNSKWSALCEAVFTVVPDDAIVISEIMYNPASGDQDEEYVELYNCADASVTLFDPVSNEPWKFTSGIDYTFPAGEQAVTLVPGGFIIIAKNPTVFTSRYHDFPADILVLGPYDGKLSNKGELLELSRPSGRDLQGNIAYQTVDTLAYDDASPWPEAADGTGQSLVKKDNCSDGSDPANWQAEAPSPGQ